MKLGVYDIEGKKTSEEIELNPSVFETEISKSLLHQAVKVYLANQRQGTVNAKGRSEVNGSKSKIFRQKGTGGARGGSKRSPVRVGGGKTFGPSPRDYSLKMNKKQKQLARKSAYTDKANNNSIFLFDNFSFEVPKTKQFVKVLEGMEILNKKILVLVDSYSYLDDEKRYDGIVNLLRSVRNIKNVEFQVADSVSTYEILRADYLVVQKDALLTIDRVSE